MGHKKIDFRDEVEKLAWNRRMSVRALLAACGMRYDSFTRKLRRGSDIGHNQWTNFLARAEKVKPKTRG